MDFLKNLGFFSFFVNGTHFFVNGVHLSSAFTVVGAVFKLSDHCLRDFAVVGAGATGRSVTVAMMPK